MLFSEDIRDQDKDHLVAMLHKFFYVVVLGANDACDGQAIERRAGLVVEQRTTGVGIGKKHF